MDELEIAMLGELPKEEAEKIIYELPEVERYKLAKNQNLDLCGEACFEALLNDESDFVHETLIRNEYIDIEKYMDILIKIAKNEIEKPNKLNSGILYPIRTYRKDIVNNERFALEILKEYHEKCSNTCQIPDDIYPLTNLLEQMDEDKLVNIIENNKWICDMVYAFPNDKHRKVFFECMEETMKEK